VGARLPRGRVRAGFGACSGYARKPQTGKKAVYVRIVIRINSVFPPLESPVRLHRRQNRLLPARAISLQKGYVEIKCRTVSPKPKINAEGLAREGMTEFRRLRRR